jgi:hypothetical protein
METLNTIESINQIAAAIDVVESLQNDALLLERLKGEYGVKNFQQALIMARIALGHKVVMLDESKTDLDALLCEAFDPNAGAAPESSPEPSPEPLPVLEPAIIAEPVNTNDILNELNAAEPVAPVKDAAELITALCVEANREPSPEPVEPVAPVSNGALITELVLESNRKANRAAIAAALPSIDDMYKILNDGAAVQITFTKKSGELTTRNAVADPGADCYTGTGSKLKPGTLLFWDVDKMDKVSAHFDNIIEFKILD